VTPCSASVGYEISACGALGEQGAALAGRVTREAGVAAVADEQHVKAVVVRRRDRFLELSLRLLRRQLLCNEAETGGDAVDVGIHGQSRHSQAE
jgi:hypothetical protein